MCSPLSAEPCQPVQEKNRECYSFELLVLLRMRGWENREPDLRYGSTDGLLAVAKALVVTLEVHESRAYLLSNLASRTNKYCFWYARSNRNIDSRVNLAFRYRIWTMSPLHSLLCCSFRLVTCESSLSNSPESDFESWESTKTANLHCTRMILQFVLGLDCLIFLFVQLFTQQLQLRL